jgi:hypothetical protein
VETAPFGPVLVAHVQVLVPVLLPDPIARLVLMSPLEFCLQTRHPALLILVPYTIPVDHLVPMVGPSTIITRSASVIVVTMLRLQTCDSPLLVNGTLNWKLPPRMM